MGLPRNLLPTFKSLTLKIKICHNSLATFLGVGNGLGLLIHFDLLVSRNGADCDGHNKFDFIPRD